MMQQIFEAFFSKETIVHSLHVILCMNTSENKDPILNFLLQLIQLPVCLALTDVGYAPFRNDTTIIYLYDRMSRKQLLAICECVQEVKTRGVYVATVQMGGGLYLRNVNDMLQHFIDPSLVLFASNVLIRNSVSQANNKQNISNLIIQRVLSAVNVSRDKISEAEEMSQEYFRSQLLVA